MKLKGIILDVDGTLADTEEIHRQAFNLTFEEYKLDWHWSVDNYRELLHISGGKERFRKCLNEDKELKDKVKDPADFIQDLHRRKSENYRSLLASDHIQLRPGVQRLLDEAKNRNIRLGVATCSSTANLRTLINSTLNIEPEEIFSTIITCDIVADKKPSPIAYQCALSSLGLTADSCIAIEDTYNGNRAALNAELKTIITTHQYTKNDDFTGASLVVNQLGEPGNPFTITEGDNFNKEYVDIELLDKILNNSSEIESNFNEYANVALNIN